MKVVYSNMQGAIGPDEKQFDLLCYSRSIGYFNLISKAARPY